MRMHMHMHMYMHMHMHTYMRMHAHAHAHMHTYKQRTGRRAGWWVCGGGAAAWSGGSRSRLPGTVWASRDYMMTMCRLCVCTVWCIEYIKYHKTTMNLSL